MSRSFSSGFRHGLARAAAVVGLVATVVFVSAPSMASAATVPLAGSTFSISSPGSLSGTSGQAITPVQFAASNVDVSTSPATTSITWVAGQLPAGLTLSATGQLSGTLSASIPNGVYDLRVIATEKVTYKSRRNQSVTYLTVDFATQISVSGPSFVSSNQTVIGSGFSSPDGVAVDSSGHVFVADIYNNRIVTMNSDGPNQTSIGSGFNNPFGVAVDSTGHVFVADSMNHRIVKMNSDGSNQTVIGSGFSYPYGVAVDSSGHVFVADTYNSRIVRMNSDGSNQTSIGSGFWSPFSVAVDSSGHVFVADIDTSWIVKMDVDGLNQTSIGSGFNNPSGVAVDSSGHVFVADTFNNRIVRIDVDGSYQTVIRSGFWKPYGVAVDSSGRVFVADTYNDRMAVLVLNAGFRFRIPDQTIPSVEAGQALAATQLVSAEVDPSTSPRVTSVKWFAPSLPAGLRLSSSGVLSGTPLAALDAGTYSVYVSATERVTTKTGTVTTVTTKTTSRVLQIVIT
ncbi:MAG: hypothetical protein F2837_07450 [Actinobacteria bacterium]|uniref:Unannotated protein n=1 Tax=freshwater metagenome TaxID=449393 RepID=A0A6J7JMT0_9ZZZZ|nr:hypothetical protein [Actinomycetota bacterium]